MSKRILVVEDQPDNRQIIRDMLAPTDYEITEVELEEGELIEIQHVSQGKVRYAAHSKQGSDITPLPGSRKKTFSGKPYKGRAWQFNHRWLAAATRSNNQASDSTPYARTVARHLVTSRGIYFLNGAPHAGRRMPPQPHDRLARTAVRVPVLLAGSRSPRQTMA
jgi:hypothetical protein